MAYSPTTPCLGSIPFTGELKDGLVLVIATVSEDSGSEEFVSSVFYKNKWHNTQACYTGIVLTSVEVKDGKNKFYWPDELQLGLCYCIPNRWIPNNLKGDKIMIWDYC